MTVVKNSALNSTIKTLEPIEQNIKNKNKSPLKILSGRSSDSLKTYKVTRKFSVVGLKPYEFIPIFTFNYDPFRNFTYQQN